MWGIVPAAGHATRIQPLAFSKELLPIAPQSREGTPRPRAVSEYLVDRMSIAGVRRFCFVIAPAKVDIVQYYGRHPKSPHICYAVQPEADGLCDAIFRALPFISGNSDDAIIGLPDTIWFPEDALCHLPPGTFSLLLFPTAEPESFDAVETTDERRVRRIWVKQKGSPRWIWGAMRMPVRTLRSLHELWLERGSTDHYLGTLIQAYVEQGGEVFGLRSGLTYIDVGTVDGYRNAMAALDDRLHLTRVAL